MSQQSAKRATALGAENWEAIFDAVATPSALVAANGDLIRVNQAWRAFFADSDVELDDAGLGSTYTQVCERAQLAGEADTAPAAKAIGEILDGTASAVEIELTSSVLPQPRWLRLTATAVDLIDGTGAVVCLEDITLRTMDAQVSDTIARVGSELTELVDRQEICDRVCQLTVELLPAADASLFLMLQPDDAAYEPVAHYAMASETWETMRVLRFSRGLVDRAAESEIGWGCVHVVTDAGERPVVALQRRFGYTAGLYGAVLHGGKLFGNVVAYSWVPGTRFTRVQQRMMNGIAQLASFALTHAALFQQVEQASRIKSDFVAAISHELRTPLNIIMGYNELLLDGEFGPLAADQIEPLRRIATNSRGLLQLIESTLDLSRLEAGRTKVEAREVDVAEVLAELQNEMLELTQDPAVTFVWRAEDGLSRIVTDPLKLRVVLKNLVDNARKFTTVGCVEVVAGSSPNGVEVSVRDTGSGIPPEALSSIFERFQQGGNAAQHQHGGVGLGLHIVRRLLDLLGGEVAVESEVGRGSCFTVTLPLRPPAN